MDGVITRAPWRRIVGATALALAAASLTARQAAGPSSWAINTSGSAPYWVWRVAPLHGDPRRGQWVLWCPPDAEPFRSAREQGVLGHGRCPGDYTPLLKMAAAVPGDRVEIAPDGVRVNGRTAPNSAALAAGARLYGAPPAGARLVADGEAWLMSFHHPASFDSRYFGPVAIRQIEGVAVPWGAPPPVWDASSVTTSFLNTIKENSHAD